MVNSTSETLMNILALECSLPQASVCLFGEEGLRVQSDWQAARNHDAHLFPALKQALDTLGKQTLDLILVGAGPGSYGGVRVALAAATGLSLVHKTPVVALGSWEQFDDGRSLIISDARRGGWTVRHPDGRMEILAQNDLQTLLDEGNLVDSVETEEYLKSRGIRVHQAGLVPTAAGLIHSWLALSPEQKEHYVSLPPEPIYVRPPHIVAAKHKPWEIPSCPR